jgi:Bax inhibitor 1
VFDSILVTAFVGTAIAFACFSCAAIVAKRREYLYLGGLLSSGLSILLWLQFAASIFGHSTGSFMFEVSEPFDKCFDDRKRSS